MQLFDGYYEEYPGYDNFWNNGFPQSLIRAGATNVVVVVSNNTDTVVSTSKNNTSTNIIVTNNTQSSKEEIVVESKYSTAKILRHRILGHMHEEVLERILFDEGYYDYNNDDDGNNNNNNDPSQHTPKQIHDTPTFGNIWRLFFVPSPAVEKEIMLSLKEMNLLQINNNDNQDDNHDLNRDVKYNDPPSSIAIANNNNNNIKNYTAVHCRVRHPKAYPEKYQPKGKDKKSPADKTGLPWHVGIGSYRQIALEIATNALQCAVNINTNNNVLIMLLRHNTNNNNNNQYISCQIQMI